MSFETQLVENFRSLETQHLTMDESQNWTFNLQGSSETELSLKNEFKKPS